MNYRERKSHAKNINKCNVQRQEYRVLNDKELAEFRSSLCVKHCQGICHDPDKCPHSHCLTWQRRDPTVIPYVPTLCPDIEFVRKNFKMALVRRCTRGRHCPFAHSKEEELYHPAVYKTKLCRSFPFCMRYHCPFAHTATELRVRAPPEKKPVWSSSDERSTEGSCGIPEVTSTLGTPRVGQTCAAVQSPSTFLTAVEDRPTLPTIFRDSRLFGWPEVERFSRRSPQFLSASETSATDCDIFHSPDTDSYLSKVVFYDSVQDTEHLFAYLPEEESCTQNPYSGTPPTAARQLNNNVATLNLGEEFSSTTNGKYADQLYVSKNPESVVDSSSIDNEYDNFWREISTKIPNEFSTRDANVEDQDNNNMSALATNSASDFGIGIKLDLISAFRSLLPDLNRVRGGRD